MEKLDLTQTTPPTSITFKEVIDRKTLIKMLLDDTILKIQNVEKKKTHEFIEIENERHHMEDILRKGIIVKKNLTKPIEKNLLHIYYNHTDKYKIIKPLLYDIMKNAKSSLIVFCIMVNLILGAEIMN